MLLWFIVLLPLLSCTPVERVTRVEPRSWLLAMNLNPGDSHTMHYSTGWTDDQFVGTYAEALSRDYINRLVWKQGVRYLALVRHQEGEVDAVKVFRFREPDRSLLDRFRETDPGRTVVTEGGPLQENISRNAPLIQHDPIFSASGDVAFNWNNSDNGHRIVLTGGQITATATEHSDKTRGLGNDFRCDPVEEQTLGGGKYAHEASLVGYSNYKQDGGTVLGSYALYVSKDADNFPLPGARLQLIIQVEPKHPSLEL